jgi:hypothetical protein
VAFVVVVALTLNAVNAVKVGGGTGGGTSSTTSTSIGTTTTTIPRSRVKVQVANGTSRAHFALTYSNKLTAHGWDVLSPINATSKAPETIVYYRVGFHGEARSIANEISAHLNAVQPLGGAKPVAGYAGDDVIVVLGANAPTH